MKKEAYQENLYQLPYHWTMRGYSRVSMEFRNAMVIRRLNDPSWHKILDLGCGDGYFMACLKKRFRTANVIGADYNLRALRFARIMTDDAPCLAMSAAFSSFRGGSFDVVLLLDVIEHLNRDDRDRVIDQVGEMLKPGGIVIVTVPSSRVPVIPMHYDHFTRDGLESLMRRKFGHVEITGCCWRLPILHHLTRFPILWRTIYFIIRECRPERAATLIGYGQKNP